MDDLERLQRMLNEDETELSASWSQVPEKWRQQFKSWVVEYKQQTWDGMWEKAWFNYYPEFLRYLVDVFYS